MTKILVTGGSGLVGSEFKGSQYVKPNSKYCDFRDQQETKSLFDEVQPDCVIHCAAKVGGIFANINQKADFFRDNVLINTNVLHQAYLSQVDKLVAFLSTCIFPDDVEYPLTEDKIHLGPPHFSNDAYAYAKRMLDVQCRAYRDQYQMNFVSVIPCNIYGPNDNYSLKNGHVIPSLIHKAYLAKLNNEPLVVWGTGKALREFIFSSDAADLTKVVLDKYNGVEPIILSSGVEVSIEEIVSIIVKLIGFDGPVKFTGELEGQLRKPSDNSKIMNLRPDFRFVKVEEGLAATIEHFVKRFETVRK